MSTPAQPQAPQTVEEPEYKSEAQLWVEAWLERVS
jgi:hypothetical protein